MVVKKRNLFEVLKSSPKSILLIGPRQTGKSTLIKFLNPEISINLASEAQYLEFSQNPKLLEEIVKKQKPKSIFIDEVQRIPGILNTVQYIIDDIAPGIKFYLTGSSARKLKRGKANLLPGRLFSYEFGPFVISELNGEIDLEKALSYGMLPEIFLSKDSSFQEKLLRSYAGTYLREEIQAEALVKQIEGFSRFLSICASYSGHILNFSKLSFKAQIPRQSAVRYFEILEDTLIVKRVDPFLKTKLKGITKNSRFFFFDVGVLNALLSNFIPSPDRKGLLFEHFLFAQIYYSAKSYDKEISIKHFRTKHGTEVDFVIEYEGILWAIEAKASQNIGKEDLRHLQSFKEHYKGKLPCRLVAVYSGERERESDGVEILPWQTLLKEMNL